MRRANEILKAASFFARELDPTSAEEVTAFVDERRACFGVEPICQVLQVATYYAVNSATSRRRRAPAATPRCW